MKVLGAPMSTISPAVAFNHLNSLSIESRIITTPWSRVVRGIGLGQYPIDYSDRIAGNIQAALDSLSAKIPIENPYNLFTRRLVQLLLKLARGVEAPSRAQIQDDIILILDAVRAEKNPYLQVMAGSIAIDAFVKIGIPTDALISDRYDFPDEILAAASRIKPGGSNDENSMRHGHYEKLSALSSLFLAFGQINIEDRLVSAERNLIVEALDCLEDIPTPFFRGRGGAVLLSIICLIGKSEFIFDGQKDYMKIILDHLDCAEDLGLYPFFPQSLSVAFSKTYPLVTMLNAIAISGRLEYLSYKKDRLLEMRELWNGLQRLEKTHMGLYYLIALHNMGYVQQEIPDLNAFLTSIIEQLDEVDPGEDYFAHGLSYHYMIQTAMLTGRLKLVSPHILHRLADSFLDLNRTPADIANRPYTISYAINILGEIGQAHLVFGPRERYAGKSAVQWVIENLSENGLAEGNRLYMLNNVLISYALRMRGRQSAETELFSKFRFPLTSGS